MFFGLLNTVGSGFTNIASGVFAGSTGAGGGSDGPYLYGDSSMFNFDYSQPFSIGIWVFIGHRGGDGAQSFVAKLDAAWDGVSTFTAFRGFSLGANGAGTVPNATSLYFQLGNTINNRAAVSSYPTNDMHLGQWNFVCATSSGSGTAAGLKIYVNGILQAANQTADTLGGGTILNSAPFTIGGFDSSLTLTGSPEGYERCHSNLNQATIWNKALSGTEVAALYSFNNGAPSDPRTSGPVANLIGYYPLVSSKDTSSVIEDVVGGNNLTNSGVTLNGPLLPLPLYQNASSGSFDGSTSYLDFGDVFGTNIGTSAVTYSLWVNPTSLPATSNYACLLNKQNVSTNTGMHLYINNAPGTDPTSFNFQLVGSGGGSIVVNGPTGVFTAGQWTHLVLSYDGSQSASGVKAWANGQALTLSIQTDTLSTTADNPDSFQIGQWDSIRYFHGLIDEFAIFSSAISGSEVAQVYGGGNPPDLTGFANIIAWFRFEDAGQYTGFSADDSSYVCDRIGFVAGTNSGVTYSSTVP